MGSGSSVPSKLQARILEELHDSHLGIVRIKALARSYVWRPGMNQQVEEWLRTVVAVNETKVCQVKFHCTHGTRLLIHGSEYTLTLLVHFEA